MSLLSLSLNTLSEQPEMAAATPNNTHRALDALSKFIPIELLAPYVAALSLIQAKEVKWEASTVYWCFIIATPIAFLLFHFARIAMAEKWPPKMNALLLAWKAIAATVAFAVWAIAVPTNSLQSVVGPAFAGFLAILISPILTAIDAIMVWVFRTREQPVVSEAEG